MVNLGPSDGGQSDADEIGQLIGDEKMNTNISNHTIKFQFNKMEGYVRTTYEVFADQQCIGRIKRTPGGWNGFDTNGKEVTYRAGPRKYAAEHLAYLAGILDGNYNAV